MTPLRIAYLTNTVPESGIGYRAHQLLQHLKQQPDFVMEHRSLSVLKPWPGILGAKTIGWIRAGRRVRKELGNFDVVDITNQTLSFITSSTPTVVTVHDLIEVREPQSTMGGLASRYLYAGIPKADHLIAVSEYTAQTVREQYHIPSDRITVIPNGVGSEFHPIADFANTVAHHTWRHTLKITPTTKIVLYVGSEHPRKNVPTALRAFAALHKKMPDTIFIKAGSPGLLTGRAELLSTIDELHIKDAVHLLGVGSTGELNVVYNLADVVIYPSRFEGFGLPPLQAMAAGTPVVTSNTTSLPEVVGDAGLMHDPDDMVSFTQSLEKILSDDNFASSLREKGLRRAQQFSWDTAAESVAQLYHEVLR